MKKELMTLQELTDKLQTLCHNGHAQKTVVLYIHIDSQLYMSIPNKNENRFNITEESVGIDFGEF